jgi:glycosyltransferase involved in cell wall biosynthesis
MCKRFLKTHVFVSPSTIENESNSLSEAKILGTPCVASYVGGVTDRLEHGIDGFFYPANEPYMLAYYICQIFKDDDLALILSQNAREHAIKTHDKIINSERLIQIYKEILYE